MAYIRDFKSYKKFREEEQLNEEILGLGAVFQKIVGALKGLYTQAAQKIKKEFGANPTPEQVNDAIEKDILNPVAPGYIFKPKLDEFAKLPGANEQACLDLIRDLIDPQLGLMGKQGLQVLYDEMIKAYGPGVPTVEMFKFFLEKIRNMAIKDYKYGGGPDLKVVAKKDPTIAPEKLVPAMTDTTHLPLFKTALKVAKDDKARKDITIKWVKETLTPRLKTYATQLEANPNSAKELEEYLKGYGKKAPKGAPKEGYKAGETVIYKRDKFVDAEWAKLTEEDKKKTGEGKMKELIDKEMIGIKALKADVKDTKNPEAPVQFEGFTKKVKDILGKVEAGQAEGQEDLVKTLGDVKTKNPEAIKKVGDIAKLYQDPAANKEKIAEIEKALSGGA